MNNRLTGFCKGLTESGLEAALVLVPQNIRYLTGYTGEGALLVLPGRALILTDFRYVEQAARESPECECVRTTAEEKLPRKLELLLNEASVRALAVEFEVVTMRDYRMFEQALPGIALVSLPPLIEDLRMVKGEEEIACIVRASEIACCAFDEILGMIKPGLTEREVQLELDYRMLRKGAEALAFSTIACAGVNGSLPHAVPSDRKIRKGELLTLDFGAQVGGYKTDMTRTVAVGKPEAEVAAVYETVLAAQLAALDVICPGLACKEADRVARDIIDQKYPGRFGHSLGHGVGLCIHEQPSLSATSDQVLAPGHVVTVEPGVYLEGFCGCRIEDTVILRKDGYVNVITAPKNLIIL